MFVNHLFTNIRNVFLIWHIPNILATSTTTISFIYLSTKMSHAFTSMYTVDYKVLQHNFEPRTTQLSIETSYVTDLPFGQSNIKTPTYTNI